ncbi:hypothetical protein ACQWU4_03625 [Chryseobacterium sp. MIQD13]|uniref:hypothetical protein n=1 Tax=Chryseobacterium sp. MIQD13 TaxID=3422310 RepID=UPI003D2BFC4A
MKKIQIYISILLSLSANCFLLGQVGVGTQNPQGIFHIDGSKDNNATGLPTLAQQTNDFVIMANGRTGIGNVTPSVELDVRDANGGNSAVGIGNTDQTPSAAGAGAIKYDPSISNIVYSNGSEWIQTKPIISPRVRVVANNSSVLNFPNNSMTDFTSWSETTDTTNSFDPITGVFTAPRNGVYNVSMAFNFANGSIASNSFTRLAFISSSGETNYCLSPYAASGISDAGDACSSSFYLTTGQTLKTTIFHNLGPNKILNIGSGYNSITILEN